MCAGRRGQGESRDVPEYSKDVPRDAMETSWGVLGTPRGSRRNFVEIGGEMDGLEVDFSIAHGNENAFWKNAV